MAGVSFQRLKLTKASTRTDHCGADSSTETVRSKKGSKKGSDDLPSPGIMDAALRGSNNNWMTQEVVLQKIEALAGTRIDFDLFATDQNKRCEAFTNNAVKWLEELRPEDSPQCVLGNPPHDAHKPIWKKRMGGGRGTCHGLGVACAFGPRGACYAFFWGPL